METDKKVVLYVNNVQQAHDMLHALSMSLSPETTFSTVKACHQQVTQAHKDLKKACRVYRRRMFVRRFWFAMEEQAVTLGYLKFDEVDKP